MLRALTLVATLLVVSLAGCSEKGSSGNEDPTFEDFEDEPVAKDEGVIRGVVLDESIQPIVDATVKVGNTELEAQTNENGAFQFSKLQPGEYFLSVQKVGYKPIQTSVNVVGGVAAPDVVKIQLPRAPGTEPVGVYSKFDGYIGCAAQAANRVINNICGIEGIDPDEHQVFEFGRTDTPTIVQTELIWEFTQTFGERLGTIQYLVEENGDLGDRQGNIWGTSPLICRVDAENDCDNGDGTGGGGSGLDETGFTGRITTRVYANCFQTCVPGTALGVGVVLQQRYTLMGAIFYNVTPGEDWLYHVDGEFEIKQ